MTTNEKLKYVPTTIDKDNARQFAQNLREALEKVEAMAEGKQIQGMPGEWIDFKRMNVDCLLSSPERFRVKPEPREWWKVIRKDNGSIWATFNSLNEANNNLILLVGYEHVKEFEIIHVREVLP